MVRDKPLPVQPKFRLFVDYEFRHNGARVNPRDIATVEYVIRKGLKQVEMYENKSIKDCWVSREMIEWGRARKEGRISATPMTSTPTPKPIHASNTMPNSSAPT